MKSDLLSFLTFFDYSQILAIDSVGFVLSFWQVFPFTSLVQQQIVSSFPSLAFYAACIPLESGNSPPSDSYRTSSSISDRSEALWRGGRNTPPFPHAFKEAANRGSKEKRRSVCRVSTGSWSKYRDFRSGVEWPDRGDIYLSGRCVNTAHWAFERSHAKFTLVLDRFL